LKSNPSPFWISGTAYTPFLRRFTDERATDLAEIRALHQRVTASFKASVWGEPDIMQRVQATITEQVAELIALPPTPLVDVIRQCQLDILARERTLFQTPVIHDWSTLSLKEQIDLRRYLRAQEHFLANAERVFDLLASALTNLFAGLIHFLPPLSADPSQFSVPLYTLVDANDLVDRIIGTIGKSALADAGLFIELNDQIYRNACAASKVVAYEEHKRPLISAADSDRRGFNLIEAYLKDTPFLELFNAPVPFHIPQRIRFEHMHIVAASGHGKTQTLQHLVTADLTADDVPSLVIVDGKGDLLKKVERLSLFNPMNGKLADRLIIIDPTDTKHPPALNLFDIDRQRLASYEEGAREQIENGTIELYDYIFGALLGAELTQKQSLIFRYLARLMLSIPNATIHDLLGVLQDAGAYWHHVEALPKASRAFFELEFNDKQFAGTKKQILRRLWGILEQPSFERMFSQPKNRIDMYDALNSGKIVLVNTAKDFLKAERASLFGRTFIALTLQAALERAPIPESKRRPAFLYIDEAHEYFDQNVDELLTQARSYKLGLILAHQQLDQLGEHGLKGSLATNTSIKLVGGINDKDARAIAPDMRTTADFIAGQHKGAKHTTFAAYVRNLTPSAIALTVPFFSIDSIPPMPDAAYAQMRANNRARYTASAAPATAPPSIQVGARVQVTLNGADQFPDGAVVKDIRDGFVFVDGSSAGVPLAAVRLFTPQARQGRSGPTVAGTVERVTFPDYGLSMDALLDTGADISMLETDDLEILERKGKRHARFTLAGRGGARISIERPIARTTNLSGVVAGATLKDRPMVTMTVRLGGHVGDDEFVLVPATGSHPVLLGRTFLAGRVIIDSERTHTTPDEDDWRS
jgi:hypothetical protein